MRSSSSVLSITVALGFLAGCSADTPSSRSPLPYTGLTRTSSWQVNLSQSWPKTGNVIPDETRPAGLMPLHGVPAPDSASRGLYVSEYFGSAILGYTGANRKNKPPICTVGGTQDVNNVAVDGAGNLIEPNGYTQSIVIFAGPQMCGPEAGAISDPYGLPSDASSANAISGRIAVANVNDNSGNPGSISVCTVSGGCTTNLTNPDMYIVGGVAMDKKGNCWASAYDAYQVATLTYFKSCAGKGQAASGFQNVGYGGLDIDSNGNLVSIDAAGNGSMGQVFVYSGCKPTCTLVGGPFPLKGDAAFGHLNGRSTKFATADFIYGQVDIYSYSPTAISYQYSFNNGLSYSSSVEGVAYNRRSKQ